MHTVMIIINRLVIGGMAINSLEVINALKHDYKIILVTGAKEIDELELAQGIQPDCDFEFIRIASLRRSIGLINDVKAYFALSRLIQRTKPDIVHTVGAKPGFLGRLAAKMNKVPAIIHAYHGHVFSGYFSPFVSGVLVRLERIAASWTTRIISVSKKQIAELSEKYRIAPSEKMLHLPIGIDHRNFHDKTGTKRAAFRNKYLLAEEEIAVGIVGRIVPIKDHKFFLDVAARVLNSKPSIRFFIIGDGENLRRSLESYASVKGLDYTYFPTHPRPAAVTFTSWLNDMDETMAGLDIITLTSKNEGTPLSVIEAELMGKPVVATNVGAVDEVMVPGRSGFICKPGHIDEFVDRLLSLVQDPSLREKMGKQGKIYTSGRYSLQVQIAATRHLYNALISKNTPL